MPPPRSTLLWHYARSTSIIQTSARLPIRAASSASSPSSPSSHSYSKERASARSKSHDLTADGPSGAATNLPPESPRYIFVPEPPQKDRFVPRRMKGVLPRPRSPFRRQKDSDDSSALALSAPEPSRSRVIPSHLPEVDKTYIAARSKLAAQRRALLRTGTHQLRAREQREQARDQKRATARLTDRAARLNAPERDADRLTAPSVRAATTPMSAAFQEDPAEEAALLAYRRERYAAQQAIKRSQRADAVHELYERAGDFVVDEAGLEAAINAAFDTPFYQANPDRGVWDAEGFPENLQWLIAQQTSNREQFRAAMGRGADMRGMEMDDRVMKRGKERAMRMADVLIGRLNEGEGEGKGNMLNVDGVDGETTGVEEVAKEKQEPARD